MTVKYKATEVVAHYLERLAEKDAEIERLRAENERLERALAEYGGDHAVRAALK